MFWLQVLVFVSVLVMALNTLKMVSEMEDMKHELRMLRKENRRERDGR